MRSEARAALGVFCLLGSVALAPRASAAAGAESQVIERILAVVESRPVLLSEVRLVQRLRRLPARQALEALIDERLMFREASRLAQAAVSEGEEERAYESLLARLGRPAGTPEEPELRQLARRQASILKYVEFRFRPQVRIADDEVRAAWEREFAGRPDGPPLEAAAPELRRRLEDRELGARIEAWVAELREGAEIRYNPLEPSAAPAAPGS